MDEVTSIKEEISAVDRLLIKFPLRIDLVERKACLEKELGKAERDEIEQLREDEENKKAEKTAADIESEIFWSRSIVYQLTHSKRLLDVYVIAIFGLEMVALFIIASISLRTTDPGTILLCLEWALLSAALGLILTVLTYARMLSVGKAHDELVNRCKRGIK